ncbi:conserved hypothetical protein [Paecilomyces variotii No. 5]|uniref:Uncharacterized protein n=1 Tax=Byssochlamys spectabilis (strain No. 5 / NBRC 109023) TaxID=1356009 RepID=V5I4J1_BYSSN|nr:conserved hypothetical protein [Paecilomyces variotii No. 5]
MENHLAELFARQVTLNNLPPSSNPRRDTAFPLQSTLQCAVPDASIQSFHDSSWKSAACLGVGDGRPIEPTFGMLGQRDPERLSVSSSQSDISDQQRSEPHQTREMTQNVTRANVGQKHPSASLHMGDRGISTTDVNMDMDMDDRDDCEYTEGGAEPYIMSGYEALAQREYELSSKASLPKEPTTGNPYNPAYDPVYQGHGW